MYNTHVLERIGVFQINDSCKSIDVSKDSKYLLATATTYGVKIFDTKNGDVVAEVKVPGIFCKQVEMSFSDKQFLVVYADKGQTFVRIYSMKDALAHGKQQKDKDEPLKYLY